MIPQRPRRLLGLILGSTLAAALAGCMTTSQDSAPAAPEIGMTDQRLAPGAGLSPGGQLVRAGAYDVPRGLYGLEGRDNVLLRAPDMDAYLRRVLNRVAAPITQAGYTGEVGVFVTSNAGFLAVTTPDEEVLISHGAVDRLGSEEQLAFILAHELSHVVRQDAERSDAMAGQDQAAGRIFKLTKLASDLSSRDQSVVEGDPVQAQEILRLRRQIAVAVHSLQLVMENNIAPSWTRNQERIADKVAADMLYKAGYNPLNATGAFNLLGEAEAGRQQEVDRHIKEITRLVGELAALSADDPLVGRMKGLGVQAGSEVLGGLMDSFSTDPYDDAVERKNAYQAYVAERYGITQADLNNVREFKALKQGQSVYAVLRTRLDKAREAEAAFDEGYAAGAAGQDRGTAIAASVEIARQAISGPGADAGLPRLIFHRIRKETGDDRRAWLNLEAILDKPALGPAPMIAGARYLAETGEDEAARDLVDKLTARYGTEPLYPLAYDVNYALGDTAQAQTLLAACLDEATNRRTRLQCRQRELAAADDPEEPDMMERALSSKDAGTEAKPAQAQPAAAEEDARQDPVDGFFNGVTGIFK